MRVPQQPVGKERRSHFVSRAPDRRTPRLNPCCAPDGVYWVHAFAPNQTVELDQMYVGKWLVRMDCQYVEESWGRIREAVETGALGPSAKISTDWARGNDLTEPWRKHVVCVFTRDWRDETDVLRVAQALRAAGAIKKIGLTYKPDLFTFQGLYEGNAAGEVAIYSCMAPYEELKVRVQDRARVEALARQALMEPARDPGATTAMPQTDTSRKEK